MRAGLLPLRTVALLGAVAVMAPAVAAQEAVAPRLAPDSGASVATTVALTGGLIVAGAAGAQLVGSPTAWPRNWRSLGHRVADQTGLYLVQTATYHTVGRALRYRPDAAPCPRDGLVRCAFTATFTAFDDAGRRRVNVPLVASLLVGTGASLLWRPERRDAGAAWAFVGTRLGILSGGFVAERLVVEWWAQRPH